MAACGARSSACIWACGMGDYLDHSGCWMRFFKPDDKLVLTDGESESAARRRAEAKAEAVEAELKRVKRELAALRKKRKNT